MMIWYKMQFKHCKLSIIVPRSAEIEMLRLIESARPADAFVLIEAAHASGFGFEEATNREKVSARRDMSIITSVMLKEQAQILLGLIEGASRRERFTYWIEPIIEIGSAK